MNKIKRLCDEFVAITDDGSFGRKGVVTDHLDLPSGCAVFSCGPKPMLKAVAACAPGAFVAVETEMACGLGVCMGCAVAMRDGSYKRCCKEGPVFPAKDLAWN
jgi:dihydroorotate dehydrogenase electron transfer subunit